MVDSLQGKVGYVDFTTCSGYRDPYGELMREEHQYSDGNPHPIDSHSICPECRDAHNKSFEKFKGKQNGK